MCRKIIKKATGMLLCTAMLVPSCKTAAFADTDSNMTIAGGEVLAAEIDTGNAEEGDRKFKTSIIFESYDESDTGFNELTETVTIGETVFVLNNITNLKMIDSRTPGRRTIKVTTAPFVKGEGSSNLPLDTIEEDGVKWELAEKTLVDSEIEDVVKDAVTSKRYIGVEVGVPVPEAVDYVYTDEDTGLSIETELPLTDHTESTWYWTEFHFPIAIAVNGAVNTTGSAGSAHITQH